MAFNFMLPLRITQALFAIIALGLSAYGKFPAPLTHHPHTHTHTHTHTQKKIPSPQTPNPRETDSSLMFETVVSWWNVAQTSPSPSQTNFLLFTSVWTSALAVPYLALSPRFLPTAAHKFGILAAEAVTMIFWFAAFLATAVFLSGLDFCRGMVCGAARGAVVFGAFEWYEPALSFPWGFRRRERVSFKSH
jgi:hypothetical protein